MAWTETAILQRLKKLNAPKVPISMLFSRIKRVPVDPVPQTAYPAATRCYLTTLHSFSWTWISQPPDWGGAPFFDLGQP